MSSGNTEKQLMMMKDLGVTVLICTPSYALNIAENREKLGIDPGRDLKLRVGLFGAEASSEARAGTQKKLGLLPPRTTACRRSSVPAYRASASASAACTQRVSLHSEIVDPDTGRCCPSARRESRF
jgi:phenylacetate-CoA ligase